VTLSARKYSLYRPGWDHEHCEFCGATFSLCAGDLDSGYATADEYRWVCAACFAGFREEFGRRVDVDPPPAG
jgi:hypothetical protein